LTKHIPASVADLIRHILTNTYFLHDGTFYEQTDGVAMGSPLAPVIADICMENFTQEALRRAKKKPTQICTDLYRSVDDTIMVWPHGKKPLQDYLCHLNNIHNNIRFTTELEESGPLLFPNVSVKKRIDGKLSHTVFRKPTHTDLYLHADSEHHLAQKKPFYPLCFTTHAPYVTMTTYRKRYNIQEKHSRKMDIAVGTSSKPYTQKPNPRQNLKNRWGLPYSHTNTLR
jgi:hypothetical protein